MRVRFVKRQGGPVFVLPGAGRKGQDKRTVPLSFKSQQIKEETQMNLKRTNKLLALLLAVLMVVSLLPVTAGAVT